MVEPGPRQIQDVIDRNIAAMVERRRRDEQQKSREDRIAQAVSSFAGRMRFVYLQLVIVALWVTVNLGWIGFIPRFDPSFVILATVSSVEALFLGAFILIRQNRMAALADQRADLDLHINLLTEHELTQLLALVADIAEKLNVKGEAVASVDEFKRNVHPDEVLQRMDEVGEAGGTVPPDEEADSSRA